MKPIRIWYQSYVDYENGKTYWDRLRKHLDDIVEPGTTIDIKGITPHDSYAHAIVEFRCAREVICNAVRAERQVVAHHPELAAHGAHRAGRVIGPALPPGRLCLSHPRHGNALGRPLLE